MEDQEIRDKLAKVPRDFTSLKKDEWASICQDFGLSDTGTISDMIERFIQFKMQFSATVVKKEYHHVGVKDVLRAVQDQNENMSRLLQQSDSQFSKIHEREMEKLRKNGDWRSRTYKVGTIKLPIFKDTADDLENYLSRFEAVTKPHRLDSH